MLVHRLPLRAWSRSGSWAASFSLPAWLAPGLDGHITLSVGELGPDVHGFPANGAEPSAREDGRTMTTLPPEDEQEAAVTDAREATDSDDGPRPSVTPDAGEELVGDGAIFALRAELHQRAAAQARTQGELADAKAELEARVANQERLRATHDQLRAELERLSGLVRRQDKQRADVESRAVILAAELGDAQAQVDDLVTARTELMLERDVLAHEVATLRSAVAGAVVSTEAAAAEADGLREELGRLGNELAQAREALGSREAGLDEAVSLLDEARALSASMREQ